MSIELEFQDCIVCGLAVATLPGSKNPACTHHTVRELREAAKTPMIEVTICNEWDTGYLDEDSHKVRVKTFCEKDVLAAMREREWQNTFPGRRYFAVTKIAGKLKGIIIEAGEGDYV